MPERILLTGSRGFIGRAVRRRLLEEGYHAVCPVRECTGIIDESGSSPGRCEEVEIGDIGSETDWTRALKGVDVVLHLAGKAHRMGVESDEENAQYRKVNIEGTVRLARAAAQVGVGKFIFMSTIKVNGDSTSTHAFSADDKPSPVGLYAVSKLEAENRLRGIEKETGMQVLVIRPALVYGPGVKGNMVRLMRLIERHSWFPLKGIKNQRSFIGLDNLVDLIVRCVNSTVAGGHTFLAADGVDLSTPELVRRIADSMGRRLILFPMSKTLLKWGAGICGYREVADRLCESLSVDVRETQRVLDWAPRKTVDEGLKEMTEWYLRECKNIA